MDIASITPAVGMPQAATAAAAKALVLRVGQQMTATILHLADNVALLDVGHGQQLTARLQTDRPLMAGQTVNLIAVDVQPEQVTLRLVPPDMLDGAPGQQALTALGLPDTPENRAALVALIGEGQPVTADAIRGLLEAAAATGARSFSDVQAVAFLMARDLPLTPALLAVVRQALALPASLQPLEEALKEEARQLLALLSGDGTAPPELESLLTHLMASRSGGEPMVSPDNLQALLQQVTVSLEAMLRRLVDRDGGGGGSGAAAGRPGADGADRPDSPSAGVPGQTEQSSGRAAPQTVTEHASLGEAALSPAGEDPMPEPSAGPSPGSTGGRPLASQGNAGQQALAAPGQSHPAGAAADGESAANAAPTEAGPPQSSLAGATAQAASPSPAGQTANGDAAAGPEAQLPGQSAAMPHGPNDGANAAGADGAARRPASGPGGAPTSAPGEPGQPAGGPATGRALLPPLVRTAAADGRPPSTHDAVRQLLPALDRLLEEGHAGSATMHAAGQLRQTAHQFVQAVQFQQLQALFQPTAAEPFVVVPLPVPGSEGEAALRLYVKGEGGRLKLDPDDFRVAIDLRLSQLKRVTVMIHVFHRQLTCHMEAEWLPALRLLESGASSLRENLRALGYAVDPIRCSLAGLSHRDALRHAPLSLEKLGRLNVTA